jgi:hypothetical protein
MSLVTDLDPGFYFLHQGKILKKADLSKLADKKTIIKEVHSFLGH